MLGFSSLSQDVLAHLLGFAAQFRPVLRAVCVAWREAAPVRGVYPSRFTLESSSVQLLRWTRDQFTGDASLCATDSGEVPQAVLDRWLWRAKQRRPGGSGDGSGAEHALLCQIWGADDFDELMGLALADLGGGPFRGTCLCGRTCAPGRPWSKAPCALCRSIEAGYEAQVRLCLRLGADWG